MALDDPPDRRGAETVAEFEQLALDPAVFPARVLRRHLSDQRGEHFVDRWSSYLPDLFRFMLATGCRVGEALERPAIDRQRRRRVVGRVGQR
jgi:integrase